VTFEQQPIKEYKSYGRIPKYLNRFNKQREQIQFQRQQLEEQAKLPPGTRLMPESERLQTLKDL
jgi:hypothetical protein